MNACSVHLLEFFKAKSKLAEQRRLGQTTKLSEAEEVEFQDRFVSFLSGDRHGVRYSTALRNLCEIPSAEESNYLRHFFHERGCRVLGVAVPLVEESDIKMKKKTGEEHEGEEGHQGDVIPENRAAA